MPAFRTFWSLLTGLVLACGSESRAPKPPDLGAAFPNLPLPPAAELISQTGGADALQLTFHTPSEEDRIVEYYRYILGTGNWRLVSDLKNPDGSVVLYAEQNGPPMWARIWKPKDRSGTMVQLTGAVAPKDSTKQSKGK
jgi:hypothetical protein